MKHTSVVLASVMLATLAAIGVAAVKPERASADTSVRSCTGGAINLKANEKRMLELHNRARAEKGLKRLCVHPKLQRAARAHSLHMVKRDYFSHNTKGRSESACERVRSFGYRWRTCAENIAWGSDAQGRPAPIFRNFWMKSSHHRANILDKRFKEVGVGSYRGPFRGIRNVTVWTVDLGSRR